MIDLHTLLDLKHLTSLDILPSRASGISGKCMDGEKVVGELNGSLTLKHLGEELLLEGVLVVSRLPVPLHVSAKRLDMFFSYDSRVDQRFQVGNVPESYRTHKYWNNGEEIYVVALGGAVPGHVHSDAVGDSLMHCSSCRKAPVGVSKLLICSKCHMAAYCDSSCQKAAWKVHKRICKTVVDPTV